MIVAVYCRVSTKDQDVEMQLADLRRMAEARNFEIVREYVDVGISGSKDSRPALNELMRDARRGKFKAVIVWALDRFGRSLPHLVNSLNELSHLGVEFVSYREGIDTSSPVGRMVYGILGSVAAFERDRTRERVISGIENARRKGVKLGRPRVVVDAEEAARLRAEGLSYRVVAQRLGVSVGKVHATLKK